MRPPARNDSRSGESVGDKLAALTTLFDQYDPTLADIEAAAVKWAKEYIEVVGNRCGHDIREDATSAFLFRFHTSKDAVAKAGNLPAYLKRMARNALCSVLQSEQQAKHRMGGVFSQEPIDPNAKDPGDLVITCEEVQMGLQGLTERESALIKLRYFDGLSNGEIAERLAMTKNSVAVALHRARTHLRGVLQGLDCGV